MAVLVRTGQLVGLALVVLVPNVPLASADTLTVVWDPIPETASGYVVYLGVQTGSLTQRFDVGNSTTFSWSSAAAGTRYCVQVAAYLNSFEGPRSVVTCGYTNQFPTLTNPGNQSSIVGVPTSLQLAGSDPDGAAVSYSATGLPTGLNLMSGNGYISGTPATAGSYRVTASVSDGVLSSAPQVFTWSVSSSTPGPGSADTIVPSLSITSPTAAPTYTATTPTVSVSGTAGDNVGVTSVTWTIGRGGRGTATGTANWSTGEISLKPGTNVITITAQDAAGNRASAVLTVTSTYRRNGR